MLERLLGNKPFVFFSDHDTQGAQIFPNLKYGSILSSYATDILRCPRLEWGGPTQKQLLQHLEATHADADTPWSSRLPKLLKRMTLRPTRSDHSIIRNLERMGILDEEPTLREELDLMLAGTGVCRFLCLQHATANLLYKKFHLALLSDGNHGGMERFIGQEANRRAGVVTPVNFHNTPANVRNVDVRSQVNKEFDNRESQPATWNYPQAVLGSAKPKRTRIIGVTGRC